LFFFIKLNREFFNSLFFLFKNVYICLSLKLKILIMKRNLLLLVLFVIAIGLSESNAQCTPDPNFNHSGISPDSATNLPPAYVGDAYIAVMTAVVPRDTTNASGVPATIQKICVINFTQPNITNFSWTTNVAQNCFPGGAKNCLLMTANPVASDIGIHSMKIVLETNAIVGGIIPYSQKDTVDYYQIVVNPAAGISVSDARKFFAMKNVPNPFVNSTDVHFNAPKAENYTFVVTNYLGQVVFNETISAAKGPNKYSFDANALSEGIYIYTLSNGVHNFTDRMLIQK
jgi:hypothetical protein